MAEERLRKSNFFSSVGCQPIKRSLTASLVGGEDEDLRVVTKTHVICTIGPASQSVPMLIKLLEAGMAIARLNFSHGDHPYHQKTIDNVREACKETGKHCAIMLDTKGPEIRSGKLQENPDTKKKEWLLEAGNFFTFTFDQSVIGDNKRVSTSYGKLSSTVRPHDRILVDDGLLSFTVLEIHGTDVFCRIDNSGVLAETKGVNLPGAKIDLPAVTDKDKEDIAFGVGNDIDFIAASFIRKPDDVREIRNLPGVKDTNVKIIAKIENQEGLVNYDEILAEADAIMVARGDLGVEIPLEKVATAQKMMIRKCNEVGKPVITATQMLESMIHNPRPTRAETTDVANAVFDGTDCVMLSAETAKGAWPVEAVSTMMRICRQAERDIDYRALFLAQRASVVPPISITEAVASSAVKTAWDIDAKLLIALTETGNTALMCSKYRPTTPILCVTSHPKTARQVLIARGTVPYILDSMRDEFLIRKSILRAKRERLCETHEFVIITSGLLEGVTGSTNIMKVVRTPEDSELEIPE